MIQIPLTEGESSDTSGPSSPTSSVNSQYSNTSSELFNFYCSTCMLSFGNEKEYKAHYRSELHMYNVKRGLVGLKCVSIEQFEKRKFSVFSRSLSLREILESETWIKLVKVNGSV
jgi:hypothetical protein